MKYTASSLLLLIAFVSAAIGGWMWGLDYNNTTTYLPAPDARDRVVVWEADENGQCDTVQIIKQFGQTKITTSKYCGTHQILHPTKGEIVQGLWWELRETIVDEKTSKLIKGERVYTIVSYGNFHNCIAYADGKTVKEYQEQWRDIKCATACNDPNCEEHR